MGIPPELEDLFHSPFVPDPKQALGRKDAGIDPISDFESGRSCEQNSTSIGR